MHHHIKELKANIALAEAFEKTNAASIDGFLYIDENIVKFILQVDDTVKAGEVFGKDGWTRQPNYAKGFDWQKKVQDVLVEIQKAEDLAFVPGVRPSDFPIQLQ